MATYGADDVDFILIDGYQVAGYLNEFSDEHEATLEDATVLGDEWVERAFTGEKKASLAMKGFFNDADNASNEAFVEQFAARTICYCVSGNTVGKNVTMFYGPLESKYNRIAAKGELTKAEITMDGSGEVEEGKIIATLAARTTAGNTEATPVNNGGASTSGGAAYLQVTALDLGGYDNVIFKIRDSADNVTYGDVSGGAFTAVTAAPAKQRLALAGTIKQYVAVAWAYTGSGSDQTVTAFVGLHRN